MAPDSTHDQRWPVVVVGVAVLGFALVGGWRWWLGPRRAAASDRDDAALREARADALAQLGPLVDDLAELDEPAAELRWRAPGECIEVYRVRADEHFRDASVAAFVGREEEHREWLLALRGRARPEPEHGVEARARVPVDGLLLALGADEPEIRERQLWWSPRAVGPAAPDFACRRRSWDAIEDALALGWASLPGRRTLAGASWLGASVEGRCHETTCLDEDGQFPHDPAQPCRARPWREQLAGAGQGLAVVVGQWDDGHDPDSSEIGILTSRTLVLEQGRPLHVQVHVDHRWSGVQRDLQLTRIDDCGPRTLAEADDPTQVAQIRARLDDRRAQPEDAPARPGD